MLYWVLASTKSTKVMTFGEPTPKGSVVVDGFIVGGALYSPLSKIGLCNAVQCLGMMSNVWKSLRFTQLSKREQKTCRLRRTKLVPRAAAAYSQQLNINLNLFCKRIKLIFSYLEKNTTSAQLGSVVVPFGLAFENPAQIYHY